jgi:4a-hydroxytetrahydrobiopterin dehydratase
LGAVLTELQILARLQGVPLWSRSGSEIHRTFACADFPSAIAFVRRVAEAAERADHHPDIDVRYDRVTLTLSTHSVGGLTAADFDLAATADGLAAGPPSP